MLDKRTASIRSWNSCRPLWASELHQQVAAIVHICLGLLMSRHTPEPAELKDKQQARSMQQLTGTSWLGGEHAQMTSYLSNTLMRVRCPCAHLIDFRHPSHSEQHLARLHAAAAQLVPCMGITRRQLTDSSLAWCPPMCAGLKGSNSGMSRRPLTDSSLAFSSHVCAGPKGDHSGMTRRQLTHSSLAWWVDFCEGVTGRSSQQACSL